MYFCTEKFEYQYNSMRAWIYLIIASIFEVAWIYSVKFMQFRKLLKLSIIQVFTQKESFYILLPILGYVVFGIGNIILFSKAMKTIPAGIAYATWMSTALVFVRLTDATIFKQPITFPQAIFILLILVGVAGLKLFA
jgi:quaternary ammonium compound-resistance protein SugE